MLKVDGPENSVIYSGKQSDEVYMPEGGTIQTVDVELPKTLIAKSRSERIRFGQRIYESTCMACHQADGKGLQNVFPPLAQSDYLNADKKRAIQTVIGGRSGEITVNGNKFNNVMPAQQLSDEDAANVLTYVYSAWGNTGKEVTPAEVRAERANRK